MSEMVWLIFHKYGIEEKGTSVISGALWEAGDPDLPGKSPMEQHPNHQDLKTCEYAISCIGKSLYIIPLDASWQIPSRRGDTGGHPEPPAHH